MRAKLLSAGLLGVTTWALISVVLDPGAAGTAPPPPTSWNLEHSCTYCHDPHGTINPSNLLDEDVETLCLTCHGPGGISELEADTHRGHTCLDCHDHHQHVSNWLGGENLRMVGNKDEATGLARIRTPDGNLREVVFESRGTDVGDPALHSFSDDDLDGNGVFDGVCEVCHVEENEDNHNFGRTCTQCHLHSDRFRAD